MSVQPADFKTFFRDVYQGKEPFPWQDRLARRACEGDWRRCLAAPTAAGKTACIDIAVFALACQADRPPVERTAPRRIFFVVDRRIVVDQAFEHARMLGRKLADAREGVLGRVADALRRLGADPNRPLDVYALRGGMYRESTWVRSPLQPTVITSTVDQVGSRLLFRGYGVSDSNKPLHAALVGNDALILLDEAHCARPFDQTMTLIEKYRSWGKEPLPSPFHFVTMTATPSADLPDDQIERLDEDDVNHPVLGRRMRVSKPAVLVIAEKANGAKWRDELVKELVRQARSLQNEGLQAVGVIVNRVATARQTAVELRKVLTDRADVVLITGRMRPIDRDAIMGQLEPLLSGRSGATSKPIFVVATQCVEVGADLDFHALVTECASLDALRQRFGRLNRVAARNQSKAVIVVRADQTEPAEEEADADPVYGNSLANTWRWLKEHAKHGVFDFGVATVGELTRGIGAEDLLALNAPAPDAAVLLPAHLDAGCQTSPVPMPDPDPAVFLHGPARGLPEVQVAFRADLGEDESRWPEIVSLCPPSSSEALPVRLGVFKLWLKSEKIDDDSSDVEGDPTDAFAAVDEGAAAPTPHRALRWRGPDARDTAVVDASGVVTPGDLYVVPISNDAARLGDFPMDDQGEPMVTDVGDEAHQRSRDRVMLRLRHDLYHALDPSFDDLGAERMENDEIDAKVEEAIKLLRTDPNEGVRCAASNLAFRRHRMVKHHPLGGLVLIGKRRLHRFDPTFVEPEESWEAASDRSYPLDQHCNDVVRRARQFAEQSGLAAHAKAIEVAGQLHDAGKADPRFQGWLHGGNRRAADLYPHPLAKSIVPMPTPRDRAQARERAGYPRGGRHELLSVRLAECSSALPQDLGEGARDLILHLIGAHHGFCRPFAPVNDDPQPVEVTLQQSGRALRASSATGLERLDSGVAERFWRLTRRFGWWGLPYLEGLLRLADWACSEPVAESDSSAIPPTATTRPAAALEAAS